MTRASAGAAVNGAADVAGVARVARVADRIRSGAVGLVLAVTLLAVVGLVGATGAAAQSPAASPASGGVGGQVDPRSSGEGPGLEAEPLIVLAGVILLGLAAAGGTALYVRLTRED